MPSLQFHPGRSEPPIGNQRLPDNKSQAVASPKAGHQTLGINLYDINYTSFFLN